jgi:predicted nucleic acid-binding Zn finger protein
MLVFISPFLRTAIMVAIIAVRKNGEINANIINHGRTQTYHLMPQKCPCSLVVVKLRGEYKHIRAVRVWTSEVC